MPTADRRQRILDLVGARHRRGVEMGPLDRPIVRPGDGAVLYADHLSTAGLRAKYAHAPDLGPAGVAGLVPIDLVLDGRPLGQLLGERGPVDYVVASHVIEHVADPVGWLLDCADGLVEGGDLLLVVPDRRFTFDRLRTPTTAGELIAHHLARAPRPSPGQVFESVARAVRWGVHEAAAIWDGRPPPPEPLREGQLEQALALAREVAGAQTYHDVHCTAFAPSDFLAAFGDLVRLGLIPFEIALIEPTRPRYVDFLVLLRKRAAADPAARAASLPRLDSVAHGAPPEIRLPWAARPARALRLLLTGRTR